MNVGQYFSGIKLIKMSIFKVLLGLLFWAPCSLGQEMDYDSMYYWGGGGGISDDHADGGDGGYPAWDQVVDDYDTGRYDHEEQLKEREIAQMMQHAIDQQEEDEYISAPATPPASPTSAADRPCHECVEEECPAPVECLAGVTLDRCGCCLECARSEGELCDPEEMQHSEGERKYGLCGDNLQCQKRTDTDDGESICVCRVGKMACGSDGITYPTICELNEEASRRGKPDKYSPQLAMEYWGPCKEAPVIISPPKDSYGPLGANLTLDCEARGHPAPEISWRFVSAKGETIALPNDDQSVSIQMRGGPEPLMVTGWAQILSLDPDYIGVYHCIATNTEGQVYSMASVGVYRNEL